MLYKNLRNTCKFYLLVILFTSFYCITIQDLIKDLIFGIACFALSIFSSVRANEYRNDIIGAYVAQAVIIEFFERCLQAYNFYFIKIFGFLSFVFYTLHVTFITIEKIHGKSKNLF
jgi:hypothetical protein